MFPAQLKILSDDTLVAGSEKSLLERSDRGFLFLSTILGDCYQDQELLLPHIVPVHSLHDQ